MNVNTVDEQVRLAKTMYRDVTERVGQDPSFTLLLDHALTSMEFARALDDDVDTRTSFHGALDLLRSASDVGPWLYRGAAQAGWVAIHLARFHGVEVTGLAPIDDIVLQWITDFPDYFDIDLPMGLLGLGIYGLVHPDASVREKLTGGVLDVIEARTERDGNGLFFRLADSEARRADQSAGCRIIGAAHGAAGLVSYLASASLSGLGVQPRARSLLEDAVRWLLRQSAEVSDTIFPHRVDMRYAPSRATWCSGDPGVALALSVAARATGSPELYAMTKKVAEAVVARAPKDCGVVDACICHGAAGLCWFGHRVHATLGLPGAARFSAHWSRHLAEQRSAGHLRYFSAAGTIRDVSFLEGDAGVALALLYAATDVVPAWEELVLATLITPGS